MKHYLTIVGLVLSVSCLAQTTYTGSISDELDGEPLLLGTLAFYNNSECIGGTQTNLDGEFRYTTDVNFTYIELQYVGYQTKKILKENLHLTYNDLSMRQGELLDEIVILAFTNHIKHCTWTCGGIVNGAATTCFSSSKKIQSREKKSSDSKEDSNNWLYPNPTSGIIHIQEDIIKDYKNYSLFNASGQELVCKATLSYDLNLTMLPDGLYTLVAQNDQNIKAIQLVKME